MKLKPCPFCGEKARYNENWHCGDSNEDEYSAGCPHCHIWTATWGTRKTAKKYWNRRAENDKED